MVRRPQRREPTPPVVGGQRHAAAIGVERLQRLEAEEAGITERADVASFVRGAERMGTILDDSEIVPSRNSHHAIHVAREAVEMRRHDGARVGCDGAFERVGIETERLGIHIGEHRGESRDARDFGHDPEGQCRKDDLGAGRQAQSLQQVVERHPPVRGADRGAASAARRKRRLETSDGRTLNELAAFAAGRDDLFGVRDHPRAVPRIRRQHAAAFDRSNSSRVCLGRT